MFFSEWCQWSFLYFNITSEAGSLDTILDVSSTTYCRYTCLAFILFFGQLPLTSSSSFRRRETFWRILWTSRQASLFLDVFSPICKRWSLQHFSLSFLTLHSDSEGVTSCRKYLKIPTDSLVHYLSNAVRITKKWPLLTILEAFLWR